MSSKAKHKITTFTRLLGIYAKEKPTHTTDLPKDAQSNIMKLKPSSSDEWFKVEYPYKRIPLRDKEQTTNTCYGMDKPSKHYAKGET